ncbi:P-loop containing nucleoside triphosphate hydrolase protein [Lophium mytilinum]|uniref:P-loop containing nucleoside triphosphate hydrolase protein n=1 Tax=Lophium mytilinum TaxID=390894 RepID=A0A6A6QL28_9PEZI|nr:P-loop containing nucleoside triphosphate hydrolase protein [Lophium mytilinum]
MASKPPRSGNFKFVIPKGSKSIPIVAPGPTKPELAPTPAVAADLLPTPPSSRDGIGRRKKNHAPKISGTHDTASETLPINGSSTPISSVAISSAKKERDGFEFDVYAKPFVPQTLTVINDQPAIVIETESNRVIDFHAYVRTFAGSAFLPARPPRGLDETSPSRPGETPIPLRKTSYQACFEDLLYTEAQAKQRENENYALYKVPIAVVDALHGVFQLYVPGLREDTPMIEMGDHIQLRQLRLDSLGNPAAMGLWLAPGGGASRSLPCPGWTGYEYNALVVSINRAQEMLFLEIQGLVPESMIFNVIFRVQPHRIKALRTSIAMADAYMFPPNMFPPRMTTGPSVPRDLTLATVTADRSESRQAEKRKAESERQSNLNLIWVRKMLFPDESHTVLQKMLHSIPFRRRMFDAKLNFEQLKTVDSVCRNEYGTLPFLISGPPGTGKTKTLVETALQLLTTTKVKHILVCAPSDPAADTLALRLSEHLKPHELLRLNGPSRSFPEVPGPLMPFSHIEEDRFYIPPMPTLLKYEIVVTTCRDAAILVSGRVTNHDLHSLGTGLHSALHPDRPAEGAWEPHWGALLMDEAAQAIEPEALIPLTVIAPPPATELTFDPQFVMAGDQKQLGPRTSSKSAAIETSLFERLFTLPVFSKHPLARSNTKSCTSIPVLTKAMLPIARPSFTNLTRNYRSHPSILATPSSLFYHDTLIPEATDTDSLLSWNGWRGRKWPVLFAYNSCLDEVEQDGGGWYNTLEARMACDYALELLKTGMVLQQDICIMSPFNAQVRRLRALIRQPPYQLWDVNIGPAEAFQGLESRVVILCTTRARRRFLPSDVSRALGLINMPKRMNVALTRAKHGLIVIGNPEVLAEDENWTAFLAFCARNGLWQYQVDIRGLEAQQSWVDELKTKGTIGELEKQLVRREEGGEDGGDGGGRVLGARARAEGEEMYDDDAAEMAGDAVDHEQNEEDEEGGGEESEVAGDDRDDDIERELGIDRILHEDDD